MGTGVRIKDIAARMGISASTVSLVLRGRGDENRISRETQKRVIQTAGEMGYPVRKSPGMGEDRRSFAIFLPSDRVVGPIQAVMKGIEKFRAKSGSGGDFHIVLYEHGALAEKAYLLRGEMFSSAVLIGAHEEDGNYLRGVHDPIPIVLVNREVPGYSSVVIDDYEIGRFAADHFLRRGHEHICVIAPDYTSKSLALRISGFKDYLVHHEEKIRSPVQLVRRKETVESSAAAVKEILETNPDTTAFFITNDSMITGALYGLRSAGKSVPGDAELISFGNLEAENWNDPTITCFDYPLEDMVCDALVMGAQKIDDPQGKSMSCNYVASCVFRDSCPEMGVFEKRH